MRTKSCASKSRVSKIPQLESSSIAPPLNQMGVLDGIEIDQADELAKVEDSGYHTRAKRLKLSSKDVEKPNGVFGGHFTEVQAEGAKENGKPGTDKGSIDGGCPSIAAETSDKVDGVNVDSLGRCYVCKNEDQILFCSSDDCPIVVHASCLGFQPSYESYDHKGRYYCPRCSYIRATSELYEAKKKVAAAEEKVHMLRKCLDKFESACKQKEHQRRDQIPSRTTADGSGTSYNHNNVQQKRSASKTPTVILEDQPGEIDSGECIKNRSRVEQSSASTRNDSMLKREGDRAEQVRSGQHKNWEDQKDKVDEDLFTNGKLGTDVSLIKETKDTSVIKGRIAVEEQHKRVGEGEKLVEDIEMVTRSQCSIGKNTLTEPGRSGYVESSMVQPKVDVPAENAPSRTSVDAAETSMNRNEKNTLILETEKTLKKPPENIASNLAPPRSKRKNAWTEEEENMLKEGVRKYKAIINKNIPWKSILEDCSEVFNSIRTATDLKDKWKNMKRAALEEGISDPVFDN